MKNRFVLQKSKTQPNGWVFYDTENGIVCVFEDGKFNETQEFTILNDFEHHNAQKMAEIVRNMSDWLIENHNDKLFYNIRIKFGQNLKKIRNENKFSVRKLAEISGVSKSTIENIEQGRFAINLDTQYKIAAGLGLHIKDLFNF